jgi:hypothetical protein
VLGWTLPNVAIVDEHGLNDAVIARHPIPGSAELLAQRVKMLRDTFALFDHDKNGRVGKDEFQPWFQILRSDLAGDPQALDRTVAAEIARFDVDGDQWVTTEEYLERARPHGDRVMAHERSAPPGYVEGFRPNVFLEGRNVRVEPRAVPMTEAEIREHEARFRDLFGVPR